MGIIEEQNAALRAQNNAPSWRDCNAAGLKHQWRLSHVVQHREPAGASHYWECARESCPVNTRTTTPDRPRG